MRRGGRSEDACVYDVCMCMRAVALESSHGGGPDDAATAGLAIPRSDPASSIEPTNPTSTENKGTGAGYPWPPCVSLRPVAAAARHRSPRSGWTTTTTPPGELVKTRRATTSATRPQPTPATPTPNASIDRSGQRSDAHHQGLGTRRHGAWTRRGDERERPLSPPCLGVCVLILASTRGSRLLLDLSVSAPLLVASFLLPLADSMPPHVLLLAAALELASTCLLGWDRVDRSEL